MIGAKALKSIHVEVIIAAHRANHRLFINVLRRRSSECARPSTFRFGHRRAECFSDADAISASKRITSHAEIALLYSSSYT